MGFKLTVILCAVIFLAMYFAPDGPRRVAAPDVAEAPQGGDGEGGLGDAAGDIAVVPDLGADPATPPAPATTTPPEVADTGTPDNPETADAAQDDPFADSANAGDTVLTLPGLSEGLSTDASDALALSDAVRNREAEGTQEATDDLLQGLLGDTPVAETESEAQPTTPNPAPANGIALVTATAVNLRAGPSTGDPVVGRVNFGMEVVLTRPFSDGWAGIEHPDTGQEVFMASRFLQVQP